MRLPHKIEIKNPSSMEVHQLRDFQFFLRYHGNITRSLDELADCIRLGFLYVDTKSETPESPYWELQGIMAIKGRNSVVEDYLKRFFKPDYFKYRTFYELGYLVVSRSYQNQGFSSLLRQAFHKDYWNMNLYSLVNRDNKKVLNTNNKYGFTQVDFIDENLMFSVNQPMVRL